MNIRTFDLNLLRVFMALYEQKNVTAAAVAIGLSQPAMSNALLRLRRSCNDRLFVRTSHGMEPTALADRMAEPVRQAMTMLETTLGSPFEFDPLSSDRKFRLLMSDVGEAVVLPFLVNALTRTAPRVSIDAVRLARDEYPQALESGKADLAIGNLQTLKEGYYQQRLFNDRYFCVVREGHSLAGTELTMQAYLSSRHIATTAGNADTLVDAALSRKRMSRNIALTVTHYYVAATIVANSDLVLAIPEHAIPEMPKLRIVELPFKIAAAEVRQFWHRRFHDDPANRWIRSQIVSLNIGLQNDLGD